jgi:hypothetical protein
VSNGKSLPKVLIAALHTAFFRPSLLDAKLVSIPSYTPTAVFRQLGDVARYAPRLVDGEHMRQSCDYSPPQPYFVL